jgi:hypothetical protein
MLTEPFIWLDAPVCRRADKMDPPSRRFCFQVENPIGRALVQTKTAMDAAIELGNNICPSVGFVTGLLLCINLRQ